MIMELIAYVAVPLVIVCAGIFIGIIVHTLAEELIK
jgi:hypothetical protein